MTFLVLCVTTALGLSTFAPIWASQTIREMCVNGLARFINCAQFRKSFMVVSLCNRERPLYCDARWVFSKHSFPAVSEPIFSKLYLTTQLHRQWKYWYRNFLKCLLKEVQGQTPFWRNFSDIAFASQFCDVIPKREGILTSIDDHSLSKGRPLLAKKFKVDWP